MAVQWNEEQLAILSAAKNSTDNIMVEALAGAAKTTTLVGLASLLKGSIISVAFNKKIAMEMKERMPERVDCKTLNSLGHSVWGRAVGKRLNLFDAKLGTLLQEAIAGYPDQEDRDHLSEVYQDMMMVIRGSKNHGHVPDHVAAKLGSNCRPLMDDEQFYDMLPEEMTQMQWAVVQNVLGRSFEYALDGTVDFADQLLMPTVMRCMFPAYDNVLVDEAQDLSELNHVMLSKLVKRRIVAVGDSRQAIYAFRGAHMEGMPLLADRFKMRTMHLSTTFRCPEAVCEHVREHVPRITAWSGNPNNPGEVRALTSWEASDIPDGAAIICRNNAPLFNMAIKLLRSGRRPNLWGNDIAASLLKSMNELGAQNMQKDDALQALADYHVRKEAKLKKDSAKAALADRIACIRIFLEEASTLGGAILFAKSVLESNGKVDLCTGHKSKGHEWDDVFFLDSDLLADEGQDLNLRYVIATRAKRNLNYVSIDAFDMIGSR